MWKAAGFMKISITYPPSKDGGRRLAERIINWCILAAAVICPTVNLLTGGKPWSVVVLWSLWFGRSMSISRDMVEYNRISQAAKLLVYTCTLLVLIDRCLAPGWAGFVVPIVCFGALITIGVLFFSNLQKQKQNMMPMVWLIIGSLIAIGISFTGWLKMNWPMIALGLTALVLLAANIIILQKDLLRELQKRFHTK